ncbi:MAG: lipoyl(octanoyl) transferase LipB [Gemmatimonadales bacterium]
MSLPAPAGRPDAASARLPLDVRRLGVVPYADGLRLQDELVAQRRAGAVPDTLLLLEHPHVITLGSRADEADVLVDEDARRRMGIEVFEVGRGGGVTYHGPGQLVAYPILDLRTHGRDLHDYLRRLEEVLIRAAGAFDVRAWRRDGLTGVWTERGKLAAIGVRVSSHWISSHGVALNVAEDLRFFETIVPCGIRGEGVTSLARELGRPVEIEAAQRAVVEAFAAVFGFEAEVA